MLVIQTSIKVDYYCTQSYNNRICTSNSVRGSNDNLKIEIDEKSYKKTVLLSPHDKITAVTQI